MFYTKISTNQSYGSVKSGYVLLVVTEVDGALRLHGKRADGSISSIGGVDYPVTKVLYLDGNRQDTYTPNGSIDKPFTTLAELFAVLTANTAVNIAPATYANDGTLSVPAGCLFFGNGASLNVLALNCTTKSQFNNITFGGNLVISNEAKFNECSVTGGAALAGSAEFSRSSLTGSITSTGTADLKVSFYESFIGSPIVSNMQLYFNSCNVTGTSTGYMLTASAGILTFISSILHNYGTGGGISCAASAATIEIPCYIVSSYINKDIAAGAAPIILGADVHVVTGITATGAIVPSRLAALLSDKAAANHTHDYSAVYAGIDNIPDDISDLTDTTGIISAKAAATDLSSHTGNTDNPHSVTKTQVGLGNVDNTSDANKPVSTAQQTALNAKVSTTVTVNGHALTDNITVSKSDVSLANVDNTADVDKPVSTAQQTALNAKANATAIPDDLSDLTDTTGILAAKAAANHTHTIAIQVTIPEDPDDDPLHFLMELSANADYSSPTLSINTATDVSVDNVKVNDGTEWVVFPRIEGVSQVGTPYYTRPLIVLVAGGAPNTPVYGRYRWWDGKVDGYTNWVPFMYPCVNV